MPEYFATMQKAQMEGGVYLPHLGINVHHEKGFKIRRPQGSGDFVFLNFLDPILIQTSSGLRLEKQNCFLFYGPTDNTFYESREMGFTHHWFHLDGPRAGSFLSSYNLQTQKVYYLNDSLFVENCLHSIYSEHIKKSQLWKKSIYMFLQKLFIELVRNRVSIQNQTNFKTEMEERLDYVRMQIRKFPEKQWRLSELAQMSYLSESRFSVLYKCNFGTSPVNDIIQNRLERAVIHLQSSNLSIGSISERCGFSSVEHFSRLFKKEKGMSPRQFRKTRGVLLSE